MRCLQKRKKYQHWSHLKDILQEDEKWVQKETKRWEVNKNKPIQKFFSLNTEEQDEEEGRWKVEGKEAEMGIQVRTIKRVTGKEKIYSILEKEKKLEMLTKELGDGGGAWTDIGRWACALELPLCCLGAVSAHTFCNLMGE